MPPQHVDELLGADRLRGVAKKIHYVSHVFFIEPNMTLFGHSIPGRHEPSIEHMTSRLRIDNLPMVAVSWREIPLLTRFPTATDRRLAMQAMNCGTIG
jgi:hypothetical protein